MLPVAFSDSLDSIPTQLDPRAPTVSLRRLPQAAGGHMPKRSDGKCWELMENAGKLKVPAPHPNPQGSSQPWIDENWWINTPLPYASDILQGMSMQSP